MRRSSTLASSALMAVLVLLSPLTGYAQDGRAALEAIAKAMGAGGVKSIQYSGSGVNFFVGQSYSPDMPWPRFVVKSYTRAVSYETASIRDELVRTLGETPQRGGGAADWLPAGSSARSSWRAAILPGTWSVMRPTRRQSRCSIGSSSSGPRPT